MLILWYLTRDAWDAHTRWKRARVTQCDLPSNEKAVSLDLVPDVPDVHRYCRSSLTVLGVGRLA